MLEGGCWLWSAARKDSGYGVTWHNGRLAMVHRVMWELVKGPVPSDHFVLHHCDVPACCNPDHLYLGNQADNMRDKRVRGRARNGQMLRTTCAQGHPYDAHDGRTRYCVECRRAYKREWARQNRVGVTSC